MATDVEIARSLNALSTTLNDQRLDRVDPARLQQIVTLALGGEERLHVVREIGEGSQLAWLRDDGGKTVGRIEHLGGGRWQVERRGGPRAHAYIPSAG